MNQRWRGGEEIEKKDYLVLANVLKNGKHQAGECVSFTSTQLFTGGWAAQFLSPQAIMYVYNNKKGLKSQSSSVNLKLTLPGYITTISRGFKWGYLYLYITYIHKYIKLHIIYCM